MIKKIPKNTSCFTYFNANPKDKRSSDCVVRAISYASGISWDSVLDDLVVFAHKYKEMPSDAKCFSKYLEYIGFEKKKQPRKMDNTKYTGKEFCELLNKKYKDSKCGFSYDIVANIGGHHIVAIRLDSDNKYKVFDIWDCTDKTIGNYWVCDSKMYHKGEGL
ncbi:MAG: hypothetical protein J6A75_03455 [Lachnospiraceae bacterium]|nr:hypothetical protein [Lachnospiraceae bacterium]